jgi:beta-glucosidase
MSYRNAGLPVSERVEDLLGRMTLEDKVGLFFHRPIAMNDDGTLLEGVGFLGPMSTRALVIEKRITHFNVYGLPGPRATAEWHNALQRLARESELGIPVTISSDPRHGFDGNLATGSTAGSFSQWPEPIGFGAAADEALVEEFGDIARQEYLAVGIRVALHPMADLATEPRWARIVGTFGEDADLVGRLAAASIRGFQGETLGPHSVACMLKHFPGGGPQKDGEDPHFAYGREQVYPGGNFEYHLQPFRPALDAGAAQVMPYYGMPVGTPFEEVGFGFNRDVITGLLRTRFGFDGVVCSDWSLLTDVRGADGEVLIEAKAWGVEDLTVEERLAKAVDAGVDQLGGEDCTDVLLGLVRNGRISEARIDESARRLLRDKFRLGLFDDPFVDPEAAERIVGQAAFREAGGRAQRRAIALLHNGGGVLPLRQGARIYVDGVDPEVAAGYGEVVAEPAEAEVAILRVGAPFEPREGFLERLFRAGSLEYGPEQRERMLGLCATVPTVVDVFLDRPAVIPELAREAAALLADVGASDAAVLDVVFGRHAPTGRLPFELPSSSAAVETQRPDVPHDSQDPLYPYGHGLTYAPVAGQPPT